jgi:outer membrane protein assembly factor BamB
MAKLKLLAALALCVFSPICWSAPPDATAYQITVDHAGATTSGGVLALQLTPRWTVTLPAASAYPLIVGTNVYAVANGLLYAFDVQTGAAVWGPTQVPSAIGATYDGGKIFVVSTVGLLSAFDSATGTPGWSVQLPGQYAFSSPPTASNGTVYVGGAGSGGTLYAVNEINGALFWTASVANGDNSSPTVGPTAVYVSYACLNTYSFDLTTGVRNWLNPTGCEGGGGETAVYANGQLFARDDVSGNDIFNASTGAILGSFSSSTPPAVDATTAYYLSAGTLSAVDLASSAVRWSFAGDGQLTSAPLIVDETVVIGSASGIVYGVNELTGHLTWQVNTGQAIPSGVEWFGTPYGFAIAEGVLIVPAGSELFAYSIFGPPAPTNVTAAAGIGAVQLAWTAASGATSYNVYVATSPGAEPVMPTLTGIAAAATGITMTNLTPGTRYYFTVKAIASAGVSAASNEVTAIPVAPMPASNLKAVAGSADVQLTWSASINAATYNVYVGTSAGGEASNAVMTSITSTNATLTGLIPGTSYYFTIKAVTNGATSAASNEAVAIPLLTAPPGSFAAAATVGGAAFTWIASPGATSYQLYVGTAAGAESAGPSQSGLTGTATTISDLSGGTRYYAILRSVAGGVVSGPSNEVSFTALRSPAPQNLVVTPGVGQIALSWNASPGATGYSVYLGTTVGGESTTPAQTVSGLHAVFNDLTSASTYYFYVQATASNGPSMPSAEVSAMPEAPPGPTNLAATGGTSEITLTWSASSGATSYNVYQGTTAGGESSTPIQTGITGLSTAISGLGAGAQYYYTVRADTADGTSVASNEASATTSAAAATSSHSGGGAIDGWSLLALALLAMARPRSKRRGAPA